jgi:hypothetical protein
MNGNIKHWILSSFALPAFILLNCGCDDSSMNPSDIQLDILKIKNIIWILDRSGYEPFRLIFNEEQFFGYDGCNWFGAFYETRNDSIFPIRGVAQTERFCDKVKTFPVQHLAVPLLLRISKNELRIFGRDGIFSYKSDATDSIENSPILRNWILTASTDPEFAEIQEQQLIPSLSFNENRGFKIAWYCVPNNIFGCDEIFGVFGIGAGNKIFFYKSGWQNHAPGLDFAERILNSSSYSVEADTLKAASLTLVNKSSRTSYKFSAISRSSQ